MLSGNNKKTTARKSSENSDASLSEFQAEKMVAIDNSIEKFVCFSFIILYYFQIIIMIFDLRATVTKIIVDGLLKTFKTGLSDLNRSFESKNVVKTMKNGLSNLNRSFESNNIVNKIKNGANNMFEVMVFAFQIIF